MSYANLILSSISNTPGTSGNLTMDAGLLDHLSLGASHDGVTFSTIGIHQPGVGREVRTGCTYTHSTRTLTRGTLVTSTTGSAINLTSAAVVSISISAETIDELKARPLRSKSLRQWTPLDNQPPASDFATLDTRNSRAVLDFTDAATRGAVFVGVIPEGATLASGLIVSLRWMATSATSGSVRWSVAWERCNTDLDSDSFDTATAATGAANGTSGIITVTDITCTTIDGLTAGDLFRLRVQRLGADGADTMTGDAELVAVEIREV
jgi:hypothetical protein